MYAHPHLRTALCAALREEAVALNAVQLPEDGSVPVWLELVPAGPELEGVDGRKWVNDRPDGVLAHHQRLQQEYGRDLVVDWEHATELKAPKGEEAPAAAWFPELEVREDGSVWGRAEWTDRGRASVANREYRYISPVLIYERASRRIVGLSSVGLTNQPNLHLQALNRAHQPEEEDPMVLSPAMRKALGLTDENATEDQALNAIQNLQTERDQAKTERDTALNQAQSPSLEKFVPRADYDTAVERAQNAEQKLADKEKEAQEAEIETAVNQALEAGKITPATVDYHKAACRQEGGLDAFKKFMETAPAVGDPSGLDGKKPEGDQGKDLNAQESAIAAQFGNTAEDLAKYAGE